MSTHDLNGNPVELDSYIVVWEGNNPNGDWDMFTIDGEFIGPDWS